MAYRLLIRGCMNIDQAEELRDKHKDEKIHGLFKGWFDSGQQKWEITYKNAKMEGLWSWWYVSGVKEFEKNYKDGELHGLATVCTRADRKNR